MKPVRPHLILTALGFGLLLAGCASHPNRSGPSATETESARTATTPASESAGATRTGEHRARGNPPAETARLPDNTGIPVCDDYLSSYVACHRAAAIYKPDQIQDRYEAMRTSLLRDSQDPQIRPQLAARCNSLASQLRQALHGKSCEGGPATPGTSPSE